MAATSMALRPRRSSLVTTRTSPGSSLSAILANSGRWLMATLPEMVSVTMRCDSTRIPEAVISCTFLLDHDADPVPAGKEGETPLHAAAVNGFGHFVVEFLLNRGADLEARDELGWTPLHFAVSLHDDPAVTILLLDRNADLTEKTRDGEIHSDLVQEYRALKKTWVYGHLEETNSE